MPLKTSLFIEPVICSKVFFSYIHAQLFFECSCQQINFPWTSCSKISLAGEMHLNASVRQKFQLLVKEFQQVQHILFFKSIIKFTVFKGIRYKISFCKSQVAINEYNNAAGYPSTCLVLLQLPLQKSSYTNKVIHFEVYNTHDFCNHRLVTPRLVTN